MMNFEINPAEVPTFSGLSEKDKKYVLQVYNTKCRKSEFPENFQTEISRLEHTAILYHSQLCAFQSVLAEKGFDLTTDVIKDYSGSIAFLSIYGTLVILGKPRPSRVILMNRIHSLGLNKTSQYALITEDLKLDNPVTLEVSRRKSGSAETIYTGSSLSALAINSKGGGLDELEERTNLSHTVSQIMAMGENTARELLKSRIIEPVGNN